MTYKIKIESVRKCTKISATFSSALANLEILDFDQDLQLTGLTAPYNYLLEILGSSYIAWELWYVSIMNASANHNWSWTFENAHLFNDGICSATTEHNAGLIIYSIFVFGEANIAALLHPQFGVYDLLIELVEDMTPPSSLTGNAQTRPM